MKGAGLQPGNWVRSTRKQSKRQPRQRSCRSFRCKGSLGDSASVQVVTRVVCLESLYQLAGESPVVVIAREPRSKLLMPPGDWRCESGVGLREGGARWQSVPSRESCSVVIRKRESRTTHFLVKAREEVKNLERSLEELHGVWGAECHHSGYRNKRDLRWLSVANF